MGCPCHPLMMSDAGKRPLDASYIWSGHPRTAKEKMLIFRKHRIAVGGVNLGESLLRVGILDSFWT